MICHPAHALLLEIDWSDHDLKLAAFWFTALNDPASTLAQKVGGLTPAHQSAARACSMSWYSTCAKIGTRVVERRRNKSLPLLIAALGSRDVCCVEHEPRVQCGSILSRLRPVGEEVFKVFSR